MKKILLVIDDAMSVKLDVDRGLISRSAYIRSLILEGAPVHTPVDVGVFDKKNDRYSKAREFCKRIQSITYEIEYDKKQEIIGEANLIAETWGLGITGEWFTDKVGEETKFICSWK